VQNREMNFLRLIKKPAGIKMGFSPAFTS